MSKSRYTDTPIVDGKRYGTFRRPGGRLGLKQGDLLLGVKTVDYTYKNGDRLDHLAAKFYNEDQYWWLIALVNDIAWPFASGGLTPGRVIKIPLNAKDVFDRLFK